MENSYYLVNATSENHTPIMFLCMCANVVIDIINLKDFAQKCAKGLQLVFPSAVCRESSRGCCSWGSRKSCRSGRENKSDKEPSGLS